MCGNLSCSKKSPESRWPLRCSLRVSTLATFTVALALLVLRVRAVDVDLALELVEASAHLGHHGVPGDEPDRAVCDVEGVIAGQGRVVGAHCCFLLVGTGAGSAPGDLG